MTRIGWLASYPKSGNTWLRVLLSALIGGGDGVDINRDMINTGVDNHDELSLHLDLESSEFTRDELLDLRPALHRALLAAFRGPLMLRKVHDACIRTPSGHRLFVPAVSVGAVYLVRDPRDVAVSLAAFHNRTIDDIVEMLDDPAAALANRTDRLPPQLPQPLTRWSDHVASWLDYAEMPVLLVRYEDMLTDVAVQLARIVAFLDLPATAEQCAAAVAAGSFSGLQAQEQRHGFCENHPANRGLFFRRGGWGGWRERLSPAQVARIEKAQAATMTRLGYPLGEAALGASLAQL